MAGNKNNNKNNENKNNNNNNNNKQQKQIIKNLWEIIRRFLKLSK